MKEIIHQELKLIANKIINLPLTDASIVLLKNEVQSLYEKLVIAEHQQRNSMNFGTGQISEKKPVTPPVVSPVIPNASFQKTTAVPSLEDILSQVPKEPIFEEKNQVKESNKTLNDVINSKNIQFALNDKIAFISHLFDGSEADFLQSVDVLSKLSSASEVIRCIQEKIKPVFSNWAGKESYEERFVAIMTRRFN